MSNPPRCSTAARRRADPLVGTAAPARRWLLVEHPAGWAPAALDSPGIGDVADLLHRTALSVGGRVVLIRRPGRRSLGGPRAWGVVDVGGGQRWGTWARAADLVAVANLFATGPEASGAEAFHPPATSAPATPLLLVCTHGKHDVCCAVRGRPVAAALAQRWPEQTWECSHIGGDRFAANLLVVPDGTVYGGLDAASAIDVVDRHLAGAVDAVHLRGFSAHPPAVQAALAEVHRVHGPAAAGDARPGGVTADGTGAVVVEVLGSGAIPERSTVRVRGQAQPSARLTCRAEAEAVAIRWQAELATA
jgi:(2Fe-2S) ferredoxin